jgi:hypothetical protein
MGTEKSDESSVHGTTFRVYRFIYRQRHPVGIRDIQEALGMASPSTAHYHVQKLIAGGLVRENGNGYTVDKVFLDNFVRIRGTAIPLHSALAAFFAVCLSIMATVLRPQVLTSGYLLGVIIAGVALAASLFQTFRDLQQSD